MRVVQIEQRTDAWHDWRNNRVTASDAAVMVNASPYKTKYQLWEEKLGFAEQPDLSGNPNVRRGIAQEDDARIAMEQALGESPLMPLCAEHDQYSRFGASFDGVTSNGNPVEMKCPSEKVYNEVKDTGIHSDGYQRAYHQVQFQIMVAESDVGWLCFYLKGKPLLTLKVERNDALIKQFLDQGDEFLVTLDEMVPPSKDTSRDTQQISGENTEIWSDCAKEYRVLHSEEKWLKEKLTDLQERKKTVSNQLQLLMGDFKKAEGHGIKVNIFHVQGSVDWKEMLMQMAVDYKIVLPACGDYQKKGRDQIRITVLDADS